MSDSHNETFQHPHAVPQLMSNEKTPVLAGAIPTFERFMTSWERLAARNPNIAPAIKKGLKCAYKYYKRMDDTDAYVVAMCTCTLLLSRLLSQSVSVIHPGIRMHWIKEHWEPAYFERAEKLILDLVSDVSQLPIQLIDDVALPSDGDIQDQAWSS